MARFSLKAFLREARRRRVFRVTAIYIVGAWVALQAADLAFPGLGIEESAILFVWIGAILGLPIALFFGWRYDIIGGRIVRTAISDIEADLSIERADYIILATLSVVVAVITFGLVGEISKTRVPETARSAVTDIDPNSIAVLPFLNMSDDPEQEYFSDGISEEILNLLAQIPEMRVTSRSSAFSFKGQNLDVPTMAAKLGVAHVLEGSVRKAGLQVRITAQLIDARSGFHLWSETYNRELDDIFAVQDEISAAIVTALKQHLGLQLEIAPRVIATANSEAHQAYLRARYLVVQRTPDTVASAVREYEKAISLDPDYALAHAELAIAFRLQIELGTMTRSEAIARAAPHAEQAMALDPNLAEAHAATSHVLSLQDNWEEALTHLRYAIQINPNYSDAHHWIGVILDIGLGRYKESFPLSEMSLRLDPLSTVARSVFVRLLINRNRLAEAGREIEKFSTIAPLYYLYWRAERMSVGGEWANWVLGELDALGTLPKSQLLRRALSWKFALIGLEKEARAVADHPDFRVETYLGRPEDAVTDAEARLDEDPDSSRLRGILGVTLAGAGDYERARPILEEMWQQSGGRVTAGGRFWNTSAIALIAARQASGEEDDIGELLAAIRDNIRRFREAGIIREVFNNTIVDYEEGLAAYVGGERDRGLALIAQGVEDGQIIPLGEAYLQVLYDDPGFAPILARQVARQARERDKVLSVVCIDNPYAAFWQPAEGTCERFATVDAN